MLSRKHRASSAEITLAKENGKLVSGWLFSFLIYDLNDRQPSRFAFIVSTKLHKRAVKRNRAKRLLRLAVQSLLENIKKGKIVLFLAKKNVLGQDLETVKKEVEKMLEKGELMVDVKE